MGCSHFIFIIIKGIIYENLLFMGYKELFKVFERQILKESGELILKRYVLSTIQNSKRRNFRKN